MSKWTQFWDMHSGGGQKLDWSMIYIEAPKDEAEVIFQNLFGRNPHRVTCTCCGSDYSLNEDEAWVIGKGLKPGYTSGYVEGQSKYPGEAPLTLEQYLAKDDVKVVYAKDIPDSARQGSLRQSGYVWVDD